MKHVFWGILLSAFFISCSSAYKRKQDFKPSFTVSQKTTHKIPKDQEYTFGYLKVLENRRNPHSKTIQIPVYIFKSRSKNPFKDPIIYTVGGPGSSTMPSAQYMKYYSYLDDRDFILVEQRGNYFAKPHLDCPEWAQAVHTSNLPNFNKEDKNLLFEQAALACRSRLSSKGIDLNGYNTTEIAQDINDLVQVLGIKKYNLLTISYSTKIAQVLMRDFPERIRSVVMDSPLPLEVNYEEECIKNLIESLDALLLDCQSDSLCNLIFPNIKNRFFHYLDEKTRNPLLVDIENPKSGKTETFHLKGKDIVGFFTDISTEDVNYIPMEIQKLLNEDVSFIKSQLVRAFDEPGNGAGIGMRLSVWCAEEYPFINFDVLEDKVNEYPQIKGFSPLVFEQKVCEIWDVKKVSDIENQAVKSEIATLLINGEYDNETPVFWAKAMSENLPNSFHLIFKAWKHTPTTNWSNPCAMQAAHDFFNNPMQMPEPDCLRVITGPSFILK